MYDTGQGVLQNYAEAVRLYRLAAEQGEARGQARPAKQTLVTIAASDRFQSGYGS